MKSTLSVHEAAELMHVHANTVFKLIEEGAIPAAKIGRAYVMIYKDVMDYVEQMVIRQTAERMGSRPLRRARLSPHLLGQR